MIVELTRQAQQDLERIGDHIALDSPDQAFRFIRDVREKCLGLAEMPERFPLVPRYEASGIRRRGYGNYLIFYRIEADKVRVIHILHGAQDYLAILFPA